MVRCEAKSNFLKCLPEKENHPLHRLHKISTAIKPSRLYKQAVVFIQAGLALTVFWLAAAGCLSDPMGQTVQII